MTLRAAQLRRAEHTHSHTNRSPTARRAKRAITNLLQTYPTRQNGRRLRAMANRAMTLMRSVYPMPAALAATANSLDRSR